MSVLIVLGDDHTRHQLKHVTHDEAMTLSEHIHTPILETIPSAQAEERWTAQKSQLERPDNCNSRPPSRDTYMRMLTEYRHIMHDRSHCSSPGCSLSVDEHRQFDKANIHPANFKLNAS